MISRDDIFIHSPYSCKLAGFHDIKHGEINPLVNPLVQIQQFGGPLEVRAEKISPKHTPQTGIYIYIYIYIYLEPK